MSKYQNSNQMIYFDFEKDMLLTSFQHLLLILQEV